MQNIRGLKYPLEVNPENRNLQVVEDNDWVKSRIDSFLDTLPLENPMRPKYGTDNPLFSTTLNWDAYAASIQRKLEKEIPFAEFRVAAGINDLGEASLTVNYSYRGVEEESFILNFSR
jgi:hypothetical protein